MYQNRYFLDIFILVRQESLISGPAEAWNPQRVPWPCTRIKNPGNVNSRALSRATARELTFPRMFYSGAKKSSDGQLNSHPGSKQSNQSTGQPSWLQLNQTSKLDSHPGCHSIKPVNWTAILAVTQSNQPVNPGGRQADLKEGLGGRQPPPGK